ncbi:hypothetical protein QYZ88_012650 [Lachnospiraceae bacterium C1.1]|nr:hypothetical protein [Lachnospiraceae bacterium C1.1]
MIKKFISKKIAGIMAAALIAVQFGQPAAVYAANSSLTEYHEVVDSAELQSENSLETASEYLTTCSSGSVSGNQSTAEVASGFVVTYHPQVEYLGHKMKSADDFGISITYNGTTYSSSDVKLKVKNGKNAGTATVTVKSIKSLKGSKKLLKGSTALSIVINPYTIRHSSSENIIGYVAFGSKKIKYIKITINNKRFKIPKKFWSQDGNTVTFSGNYDGTCYFNLY